MSINLIAVAMNIDSLRVYVLDVLNELITYLNAAMLRCYAVKHWALRGTSIILIITRSFLIIRRSQSRNYEKGSHSYKITIWVSFVFLE